MLGRCLVCAEHSDFVCSHIVSVNYLKIMESQNWLSWKGPLRVIWSCSSAHFSSVVVVPFLCAPHVYLLMPQTFPSGAVGWRGSTIWVNNVSCSIKLTSVSHCLLFTPNAGTAVFSFPPPPLETRTRCPWSSAAAARPAAPPAAGDASGYVLAAWRPGALCALLLAGDGGTKSRRGAAGPYGAQCRRRGGGRCRGARRRPCRRRARDAAQGGHLGGAAASGRAAEGRGGHQVALLSERQRGPPPRLAPSRPSGAAGRPGPARRAVRVARGQGRSVPTAACCWVGKPGTGGITDGGALINGRIVCGVLGDVCSAPIALAVVSALLPAAEHVRQEERAAVEPTPGGKRLCLKVAWLWCSRPNNERNVCISPCYRSPHRSSLPSLPHAMCVLLSAPAIANCHEASNSFQRARSETFPQNLFV